MRTWPWMLSALALLGTLAASGCQSPMYNSYGSYPTYQSQPVYTAPPAGSYAPSGTYTTPPAYSLPNGSTYTQPGSSTGGDAPYYTAPTSPGTSGSSTQQNQNLVPDDGFGDSPYYYDRGPSTNAPGNPVQDLQSPFGMGPTGGKTSALSTGPIDVTALEAPEVHQVAATGEPAPRSRGSQSLAASPAPADDWSLPGAPYAFDAPSDAVPMVVDEPFADAGAADPYAGESDPRIEGRDPYRHDPTGGYRWLRGMVDRDSEDGTWQIIYSLTPDKSDAFGGCIQLIDDDRLDVLRNDDVVLVEGRVDRNSLDRLGKPMYRVEHFSRLAPKVD